MGLYTSGLPVEGEPPRATASTVLGEHTYHDSDSGVWGGRQTWIPILLPFLPGSVPSTGTLGHSYFPLESHGGSVFVKCG